MRGPRCSAGSRTISRSSWLIASGARVVALDGDVLTLVVPEPDRRREVQEALRRRRSERRSAPGDPGRARHPGEVPRQARQRGRPDAAPPPPAAPPAAGRRPSRAPPRPAAVGSRPRRRRTGHRMGRRVDPERRRCAAGRRARAADRAWPSSPSTTSPKTRPTRARARRDARAAARGRCAARARRRAVRRVRRRRRSDETDAATDAPVPPVVAPPLPSAAAGPPPTARSATARPSSGRCSARASCAKSRTSRRRGSASPCTTASSRI